MKKIVLALLLSTASVSAMAEAPGGPNCGWGNMLFKGQSGIGPHFAATTTNGTSGNATFGMTSGTNGCSVDGKLTYGGKAMIGAVMDELIEDVARGNGEALNAVAVAYGVESGDRADFAQLLHSNFATIFPSEQVTADAVDAAINTLMKSDSKFAKYAV
ncbi:MAG: DUF3015 domain-containing protein [Gammaproteobacteria bacterium]|nr:DUF3015 domain-containing protein [Gammaproteobacteria bacterium]